MENNLLEDLISLLEQDSGGVSGHTGTKGQGIDQLYSGPFHPDFGLLDDILLQQLKRNDSLKKWNKNTTPIMDVLYQMIPDIELKIAKAQTEYGNPYRDTKIKYDKVIKMTDNEINNFKNDTNKFQPVSSFNKFV